VKTNTTTIKDHKQVCRALAPAGWQYNGFIDGYYSFQKGNYTDGFKEMLLLEEDLTPENIAFMVQHNLTRIKGFIK